MPIILQYFSYILRINVYDDFYKLRIKLIIQVIDQGYSKKTAMQKLFAEVVDGVGTQMPK